MECKSKPFKFDSSKTLLKLYNINRLHKMKSIEGGGHPGLGAIRRLDFKPGKTKL